MTAHRWRSWTPVNNEEASFRCLKCFLMLLDRDCSLSLWEAGSFEIPSVTVFSPKLILLILFSAEEQNCSGGESLRVSTTTPQELQIPLYEKRQSFTSKHSALFAFGCWLESQSCRVNQTFHFESRQHRSAYLHKRCESQSFYSEGSSEGSLPRAVDWPWGCSESQTVHLNSLDDECFSKFSFNSSPLLPYLSLWDASVAICRSKCLLIFWVGINKV